MAAGDLDIWAPGSQMMGWYDREVALQSPAWDSMFPMITNGRRRPTGSFEVPRAAGVDASVALSTIGRGSSQITYRGRYWGA